METNFKGHFKLKHTNTNAKRNNIFQLLYPLRPVSDLFEGFMMLESIAANVENISAPKYIPFYPDSFQATVFQYVTSLNGILPLTGM